MSQGHPTSSSEKQGFWWLPSEPEHQLPGSLVYGHDVQPELRLLGSMQGDFEALRMMGRGGATFRPEIILGTSSDGKDYTLVDCMHGGSQMSAYIVESFLPSIVIEGRHFCSEDEIVLQEITFRLPHLSEWYGRTGREVSYNLSDSRIHELTLKHRVPEVTTVSFGTGVVEIGLDWSIKHARFGGDFVVSEQASMSVKPSEPLPMRAFLDDCLPPITALVTLGIGRPLSFRVLRAKAEADCQGKTEKEQLEVPAFHLHWKRPRHRGEDKELFPHDMIFTCSQLGEKLEEYLTRWVTAYNAIKPVMQLFFGRIMTRETISPNTFLNAVQAAEAYHRHRREGAETPKSEHKGRVDAILEVTPEEHQQWLREKLSFSNEKSLAQRLTELLEEHEELFDIAREEIERIAKRAKDLRNSFTHYSKKNKAAYGTGHEFHVLGELMRWLVTACLLEEMGFTREQVHSLLRKNQNFAYFRTVLLKGQQVEFFKVESIPASEVPKVTAAQDPTSNPTPSFQLGARVDEGTDVESAEVARESDET